MTSAVFARALLGALFSLATTVAQTAAAPTAEPPRKEAEAEFWQTDLAAARRHAATAHKPMLVVFRCER